MFEPQATWRIRLFGTFAVENADGLPVDVKNQKVQGLLALLCYNRTHGITRADAGAILWPAKPERSRLDNLKQTLYLLRKSIGDEAVEANTTKLRLSDHFQFQTDLDEESRPSELQFMPLQEGEWFENVRFENSTIGLVVEESLTDSLYKTVLWLGQSRPKAAYDLLRDGFYLAIGMNATQLREISKRCGRISGREEWHDLWLAYGLKGGSPSRYKATLKSAFRAAVANQEPLVMAWAGYGIGMYHSFSGDFSTSRQYAEVLQASSGFPQRVDLLLKGNIAKHADEPSAASDLIAKFDDQVQDQDYWSVRMASSAFRHAANGEFEIANQQLDSCASYIRVTGHRLVNHFAQMTQALTHVSSGRVEDAIKLFEDVASDREQMPDPSLNIYAKEALSILLRRVGERERSETLWTLAHQARGAQQMAYTPWDRRFIQTVKQVGA